MTIQHYRAVFLSPHLDDAVFSCGGSIAKLAGEGPVLVLNVFSSYPAEVRRGPVVISRERSDEDAEAAALLGFTTANLDEVDAALRHPAYRSPANLFRPPVQEDIDRVAAISYRIGDFLSSIHYEAIYLPLGVGWHVDHVLSYLATKPLHGLPGTYFCEDAPYCLISNATQYRLRELGRIADEQTESAFSPRSFAREWYETSADCAALAPIKTRAWPGRGVAALAVALYLRTLLAKHRRLRKEREVEQTLKPVLQGITEHFDAKIEACYRYESQVRQFWVSRTDCVARYRRYSKSIVAGPADAPGDMVERFWQLEGAGVGGGN
jgi:LmbE family N-acetylglucosaminyl deacetylase